MTLFDAWRPQFGLSKNVINIVCRTHRRLSNSLCRFLICCVVFERSGEGKVSDLLVLRKMTPTPAVRGLSVTAVLLPFMEVLLINNQNERHTSKWFDVYRYRCEL